MVDRRISSAFGSYAWFKKFLLSEESFDWYNYCARTDSAGVFLFDEFGDDVSKSLVIDSMNRGDGSVITSDSNEIRIVDEDYVDVAQQQYDMAQSIGAKLVAAYNNRQWKVIVDIKNGMLIIACDSVSNEKGYHIHMPGRTLHELQERAVKAAGEILERHHLDRSKQFNPDKLEGLLRDQWGNVLTPDSAAEPI